MAVGNVFRGFTWNHDKDKHKDQGNKNRACRAKTMVSEFSFQQFNKNHLLDLVFLLLLADGLVFPLRVTGSKPSQKVCGENQRDTKA